MRCVEVCNTRDVICTRRHPPLFSATRIIRLFLAATHLACTRPSTLSPDATPHGPDHLPSNTSRYLPPAHAVAGLSRDQLFLLESRRRDLDQATAQWRTQHSDNPCSRSALQALREIFPNDSAGGLAVLRSCFPGRSPGSRNPSSTTSVLPPPRQCSVPGTWSAEEILSAAQWIMGNPGLSWSPTPGAGGHKQIRIRNAIINHWNSGVVNVQGRDAQLVSEKLLSTRQVTGPHSLVSDHEWSPVSRRRNRFPPSPTARISSPDCRSSRAPLPSSPTLHHVPSDLSRFSALSSHDQELPDPPPSSLTPSQPRSTGSPRRCPKTLAATTLSSGSSSGFSSSCCSPSLDRGSVALSWFFLLLVSLSELFLWGLCSAFGLARSLFNSLFCPFARKSRCVGRSRCRGYSSQLARRRGAGGRSLCLESIIRGSPTRPLWKRSLFWVSRLACMASVVLFSLALCLVCPGCHAVFSTTQSGPGSMPGYSSVFPCHVSGPASSCSFNSPQYRPSLFGNVSVGSFWFGSSLTDWNALSTLLWYQLGCIQFATHGLLKHMSSIVISWQCGLLGTRVGEASHPGPPDILGAALSEANPYMTPGSPGEVVHSADSDHPVLPSPSLASLGADVGLPPPVSGSTSPRRPVPVDSTQPPVPKRRVAVPGRWYCPVASCPDHCPVSSRGWASFSAMKGHCDRHLGGFLEGDLPLDWLREVGYGVCEVCNRILSLKYRGRCPSCWPAFVSSQPRPTSGRPLPDDMPPLGLVLSTRIQLRSSVPLGARDAWGTCLNTALAGVIAHRDSRAWSDLLMLPSLVLPSPSRGGSSRTRRSTNETRRRCQDWLNGVRLELWDPPRQRSFGTQVQDRKLQPEASFDLDDRTSTKVHSLIAEGALRRACATLTADPPVPPTTQVVDELRLLHPGPTDAHTEELSRLRPVSPGAAPDADVDQVRRALASFASTSGAGPSGLRPSHLQDALRYSTGDLTLRLLAEVVSLMLKGELPEDIRPWLCGASLMALRKPNKSLRPVAVGETLRRLCSKVCVELMGSSIRSILEPVQVGVQTKFGCEAVVHVTRQWSHTFRDDPDRVLALVDLSNAFNCVSRGAVLSAVRTHFPWLAPWADTCYRFDSNLVIGDSLIRSQRGVQQGDPLGPSLFALAIHPCVTGSARFTESRFPGDLDFHSFFLDDGVIAGRFSAVQLLLTTLETRFRDIGLDIAREKTEIIPTCTSVQNFSPRDFEGFLWVPHGNFKLLGAAIGSLDWCESLLQRRVSKAKNLLDAIGRYSDAQGAFTLLRSCSGWAKILYSCRTVPPPLQREGLRQADTDIRHSLGRLVGCQLTDDSWRIASLGVANGGLGLRSAAEHAPAAYISSLSQTQSLCASVWPAFDEYDIDGGLLRSEVESSLSSAFLPNAGIYASAASPSQKSLSAKIEAKVCHHLLDTQVHDRHRVAHLSLNRLPGAGAWLFALPDSVESHIPSPLFKVSILRRLRMPIWAQDTNCSLCGQVMDKWGDHALVCSCGGDRVVRHNMIRDVVHSAANLKAGLGAILEKPGLLIPRDPLDCDRPPDPDPPDPSSSSRRPADVWVPRGPSGSPEAWDFSVTSAFRLGPSTPDPAAFSSVFSSVETRKRGFLDTASQCAQAGIHFCPLVIEAVGGGWSEALRSVVSWIASESGRHSSSRHSDTSFKIAQRISCALHQENARAILKRAPEQAMSSGSSLSLCLLSEPAP